jgi:hypothetical protein
MTDSHTNSESFTVTHARKLAAKVTADMYNCMQHYKYPQASEIDRFTAELVVMLSHHCVSVYEFGFQTPEKKRVVSWRYTVSVTGDLEGGRSGGLYATADISNAAWFNQMTYSEIWTALAPAEQEKIEALHEVSRVTKSGPSDGNGHWVTTRTYGAGGVSIVREDFQPW